MENPRAGKYSSCNPQPNSSISFRVSTIKKSKTVIIRRSLQVVVSSSPPSLFYSRRHVVLKI